MADARHRFVIHFQADQYRPVAVAADKVLGAVDRVDDPAASAPRFLGRAFFTQNSIIGKCLHERRANQRLALAIGCRDGCLVRFCFRPNARLLVPQTNFPSPHRDLLHEGKFFLKRHRFSK